MPYRMDLPDIGEGVVEAEVQQWFVAPGDVVEEDQPLVEVMTDKATVTIPSPKRGRVLRLFWKVGEVAKVHAPLVELELEAAEAAPSAPAARPPAARAEGAGPGASARADFGPADEPHRAPVELHAGAEDAPAPPRALAAPAVRALARELGIDVNAVHGTGPGGRVTKDDLASHRARRNGHHAAAAAATAAAGEVRAAPSPVRAVPTATGTATSTSTTTRSPTPIATRAPTFTPHPTEPSSAPADERIPLRGVRKKIAENMARSKRTAAHFTFVEQVDATELVRLKDRMAEAARGEGVRLTFLPFVVKAVVAALRRHPKLNATMDEERGELVVHHRYDLGIASATESGLVVPVVRGADRRSLVDLAREIERLAADTKAGRVRPDDLGRSTFTITSLGALGGLFATPVLNHPEVAILGLHRIRPTPVVRDGQIVVRDVMHLSVTSDHRVVDGHEAAAFAYEVIRHLEDPNLVFMHLA